MSIQNLNTISSFTTVSGATDNNSIFNEVAPSIELQSSNFIHTPLSKIDNEVYQFYLRMVDVDDTKFKILLGNSNTGSGQSIEIEFNSSEKLISLVNTSGLDISNDSVIIQRNIRDFLNFTNDKWYKIQIEIQSDKIRCFFDKILCFEFELSLSGLEFGFVNMAGSSNVYVSDLKIYVDQIVYGNVNINGANNENGRVVLYNQSTYEIVKYTEVDSNGEYFIFIEDDPLNSNKYFIYGFIENRTNIQPRGVLNITLS